MGRCKFCGKSNQLISEILQICRYCILNKNWEEVRSHISNIHKQVRQLVSLPEHAPKEKKENIKLACDLCVNECKLGVSDVSYCGLRNYKKSLNEELPLPTKSRGYIHGYIDANPTNCCNAWFCPAGTSQGYPDYSDYNKAEYGTYSYAAFLYGCTFSCLFCQNYSHKEFNKRNLFDNEILANKIVTNEKITCLCYFGGTPEAQLPFSINLAESIIKKIQKTDPLRKFRICWELNGSGNRDLVDKCMNIAIKTGGNIKFDLKSFNEKLNLAMCGVSNNRTLNNFKYLADNYFGTRGKEMPEISACTLMVPGYVNYEEVDLIAQFISSINKKIPYSLLVFHGAYQMKDLKITPKNEVMKCYETAKKYLEQVNIGNKFLLNFL